MPSTLIKALTKARLAPYFHTTEVVATRYFGSGKGPMSERNRNAEGTTNDRQDQASPSHGNSQRRQTTLEEHNYARSSSSKKSKSGPRQGADSSRVSPRDHRAHLAQGVLEAIKEGAYTTSKDGTVTTWDLAVPTAFLRSNTAFYPHESPALQNWRQPADDSAVLQSMSTDTLQNTTTFRILECTTLSAARSFNGKARVGVLIFASATKPGGGFLTGAEAQEESLARASNLYASQTTQDGQRFYNLHKEKRSMYYSHSMIYSPSVSLIRDDTGEWDIPLQASMITS
ncbi:hypothetical protein FRC02_007041 [Tulasnella sp. 418]|nr:hypothetical protein FRC02_007041 [Tulasnella sp. 418]